jgi:predicted RNA binding protein YcfA (HicA-like mRNA interferase family)
VSRLRLCTYRQFARIAGRCGFEWLRWVGSHNTFRHADGRTLVVPDHGAEPLVRPLLRRLIRDRGLSVDEYNGILAQG